MEITYLGHSCFKLRGKDGTVITDPYHEAVGWKLPNTSADMVTVSHQHADHNNAAAINGTARRDKPFVITQPGEYEVGGISVFGVPTFHDGQQGVERGANTVFTILIDGVRVCHLGDLGHELSAEQASAIGSVDVVLCPVGGVFTIDPELAVKTIHALEPRYAIPMHFRTERHEAKVYGELKTLQDFLLEYGMQPQPKEKIVVEKTTTGEEETELVVLQS